MISNKKGNQLWKKTAKKEMTPEEMEKDFKNKLFNALAQKNPGVHMDQDGFIVMPVRVRRKPKE